MGKKTSLYDKAKSAPKSITFKELQQLAIMAGFSFRQQTGSHKQYKRNDDPSILITFQPRKKDKKMAMAYQVRDLLKHIDQNNLLAKGGHR